jgi:hypothetical protein
MPRLLPALFVAATLVVALTACDLTGGGLGPSGPDVTPTPEGTDVVAPTAEGTAPPAIDELVLTPEGLGTLVVGEEAAPGEPDDMVVYDPEFCTDARTGLDAGTSAGDEFAGLWVPIELYGAWQAGYVSSSFAVAVDGTTLWQIRVDDELIPTDEGIRIGDFDDAVTAAYPGAAVIDNDISELFVVQGTHGKLVVEVARDSGSYQWTGAQADRVISLMTISNATEPFAVAATGGGPGACTQFG